MLSGVHVYKVRVHSILLQPMARGLLFFGTLKRVRVCIKAGTNDSLFRLFFGAIEDLGFDPSLWNWKRQRELMSYNAREGRKFTQPKGTSLKKFVQKMEPSPFIKLQAKMARYLSQEKEQKGDKFHLVFVAQGPCWKYLEGKSKSQHPSRLSLL